MKRLRIAIRDWVELEVRNFSPADFWTGVGLVAILAATCALIALKG